MIRLIQNLVRAGLAHVVLGLLALSVASAQPAEEPIELEGATIRGEQELPIGLYITPWRNSPPEEGIDKPAKLLEEALVPVDPPAFRRQMQYWQALETARRPPEFSSGPSTQ